MFVSSHCRHWAIYRMAHAIEHSLNFYFLAFSKGKFREMFAVVERGPRIGKPHLHLQVRLERPRKHSVYAVYR